MNKAGSKLTPHEKNNACFIQDNVPRLEVSCETPKNSNQEKLKDLVLRSTECVTHRTKSLHILLKWKNELPILALCTNKREMKVRAIYRALITVLGGNGPLEFNNANPIWYTNYTRRILTSHTRHRHLFQLIIMCSWNWQLLHCCTNELNLCPVLMFCVAFWHTI